MQLWTAEESKASCLVAWAGPEFKERPIGPLERPIGLVPRNRIDRL